MTVIPGFLVEIIKLIYVASKCYNPHKLNLFLEVTSINSLSRQIAHRDLVLVQGLLFPGLFKSM
jgi:hypothetical protein